MTPGKDCIGVGCWGVVIKDNKEVLLVRKIGKNYWERPGGKVDFGEYSRESLIRELKEETGVEIKILYLQGIEEEILSEGNKHWVAFNYVAEYIGGKAERKEPEAHQEVGWFFLNELPDKISQQTKKAIKKYLSK